MRGVKFEISWFFGLFLLRTLQKRPKNPPCFILAVCRIEISKIRKKFQSTEPDFDTVVEIVT